MGDSGRQRETAGDSGRQRETGGDSGRQGETGRHLALARRLRELLLDAGELRVEVVRDLQRQVPDHSRTITQQKCGAVPSRDQF